MSKGVLLACLLVAETSTTSRADLVVSNLTNTTDSSAVIGDFAVGDFTFGTSFQAQSFTTGARAVALEKVILSMAASVGGMGGFAVAIYDDSGAGGLPGNSLISLAGDSDPDTAGEYDYVPSAFFALSADTTYWVVAAATRPPGVVSATGFQWNATSDTSEIGAAGWSLGSAAAREISSVNGDTGWVSSGSPLQIEVSAIPEASSVACGVLVCALTVVAVVCRQAVRIQSPVERQSSSASFAALRAMTQLTQGI
jgi:hypothetical protein